MHVCRPSLLILLAGFAGAFQADDTLRLLPDRDSTLYESVGGTIANGSGERLFSGVTNAGQLRRTLLRFDLSAVPRDATVTRVTLDMQISKAPFFPPNTAFALHRVSVDWGEGASDAPGEEGTGTSAAPGDATWLHTFFPGSFWTTPGGDFATAPSAVRIASGGTGPIDWSSKGMAADVRAWIEDPATNFGWMIKAVDETFPGNAKRFNSREFAGALELRPALTIEFDLGTPACGSFVDCDSNPANVASISISGCSCDAGSLVVTMTGAPPGRFGHLLVGTGSATIVDPPGAVGNLCLGGAAIGRFVLDGGLTDGSGALSTDLLNSLTAGDRVPSLGGRFCVPRGQTWRFQYWYKDGGTSRFSQALRVTLR
jgi:hypothetical protein